MAKCGLPRSDGVPCSAEQNHYGGHVWPDARLPNCEADAHEFGSWSEWTDFSVMFGRTRVRYCAICPEKEFETDWSDAW
jgi:hypothetical protein